MQLETFPGPCWILLTACAFLGAACSTQQPREPLLYDRGLFPFSRDIGQVEHSGSLTLSEDGVYELQGAGADIWGTEDAFHFASVSVTGDVQIRAAVGLEGQSAEGYRKAALMMRESFEPGAAYVDVALHQNGLASLQYRPYAGARTLHLIATSHLMTAVGHPNDLKLERRGDVFTATVAFDGQSVELGPIPVELPAQVEVGLGVASHDPRKLTTASFRDVTIERR